MEERATTLTKDRLPKIHTPVSALFLRANPLGQCGRYPCYTQRAHPPQNTEHAVTPGGG